MNCPNCGAVLIDNKCEYCGYEYIEKAFKHNVHIYHHNKNNTNRDDNSRKKINTGLLVLLWFMFFPIMIFYTIWQSKKLSFKTKIILTVLVVAILISIGVLSDNNVDMTKEHEQNEYANIEKTNEQDWNIEVYDINVDYDIDNQTVLLIDLEIEYIGKHAFEVMPSDLEFTLKDTENYIFFENKYYGKKDLERGLKTQETYVGTIAFNIEPGITSDYILEITSTNYERECDIELIIEKSKVRDCNKNCVKVKSLSQK